MLYNVTLSAVFMNRAWAGGEVPAGNASARGQLQLNSKISVKEKTIPQRFICEKGLGAKISCASDWIEYNGKCYKVRGLFTKF